RIDNRVGLDLLERRLWSPVVIELTKSNDRAGDTSIRIIGPRAGSDRFSLDCSGINSSRRSHRKIALAQEVKKRSKRTRKIKCDSKFIIGGNRLDSSF